MQKKYIILREEFPVDEQRIKAYEASKDIAFPEDYRKFLLEYNGGAVLPGYVTSKKLKTEDFRIKRFYSLQDLESMVLDNLRGITEYVNDDVKDRMYDIDADKLIFIGLTEFGNIHIYCGGNGFGDIYYSNYSGGQGLKSTGLTSFTELLESLSTLDEDPPLDENNPAYKNWQSDKIFNFETVFYGANDLTELILTRFKEVLSFYGSPNQIHRVKKKDVVSFYINNPLVLKLLVNDGAEFPEKLEKINNLESLKFLMSKGANIERVLITTNNIQIIKFLVEECNFDINSPVDGEYPLLNFTNLELNYSAHDRNKQYELIKDIMDLGYALNLNITDKKGQSVSDRIKILEQHHKEFIERYGRRFLRAQ